MKMNMMLVWCLLLLAPALALACPGDDLQTSVRKACRASQRAAHDACQRTVLSSSSGRSRARLCQRKTVIAARICARRVVARCSREISSLTS